MIAVGESRRNQGTLKQIEKTIGVEHSTHLFM